MAYKNSEIGKMLKEAREKNNLTQEDLALRVNKKRSYISRVENNGVNINIKTLQEIVEIGFNGKLKFEIEIK